ncbi:hypothetical protein LIER_27610 [Lithospermum erythrorhizon]|uniref:Reverse transcriptase zinc-binding domain-containing protein n=1 Tax=Lithospermum erythrorhizon TaxID=34254 RepID=A0AAV3RE74_LITER
MDWSIGDRKTIRIWHHRWTSYTWSHTPYTTKPTINQDHTISELIDDVIRTWDIPKLQTQFLPIDMHKILKIPLTNLHRPDTPIWKHHPKGIFTVSSAYHAFCNSVQAYGQTSGQGTTTNKFFNKLWRLKLLDKIKHFLWRVIHNNLPTSDNL